MFLLDSIFFQPVIDGTRILVDGGILSNLPVHLAHQLRGCEHYPALAFRLVPDPVETLTAPETALSMIFQVIETIISGQTDIQMQSASPCAIVEIPTGDASSFNFDLSTSEVDQLIASGENAMHSFIALEDSYVANMPTTTRALQTERGMWLEKTMREIGAARQEIVLFGGDCTWALALTPCLLWKSLQGLRIRLIIDPAEQVDQDSIAALAAISCEVLLSATRLSIRGAFIDPESVSATLVLSDRNPESTTRYGQVLKRNTDRRLLTFVWDMFCSAWSGGTELAKATKPNLSPLPFVEIEKTLRGVTQYENAEIQFSAVSPKEVCWLTNSLEPFKLARAGFLFRILEKLELERFRPLWISGTSQIIMPPIVEELRDGTKVLIDGCHRFLYCIEHDIPTVGTVVVKNVTEPLPCAFNPSWEDLKVLPYRLGRSDRYQSYKAQHFRHIGEAISNLGAQLVKK